MSEETTHAEETAVAAPKPKAAIKMSVSEYVKKNTGAIAEALPNIGLTAEAVARTALSQIYRNPQLSLCDHVSLMRSIIEAASLGLSFALGRAYLVPFNNKVKTPGKPDSWRMEAQFMPGYQGLVDLVRRSASVKTVIADAVYEGDTFAFRRGLETDHFEHEPLTEPDDAKLTHTYCLIRFNDGGYQIVVLTKKQIDKVRGRSKSQGNGPWVTDYARMAIKTAVKLCTKLCPASIELSRAIDLDNQVEMGERQQLSAGSDFMPDQQQIEGAIEVERESSTGTVSSAAAEFLKKTQPTGEPPAEKKAEPKAKRTPATPAPLTPEVVSPTEPSERLWDIATKARDAFLASNNGNMVAANKAIADLSEGACADFNKLPKYLADNPAFERVIEDAIGGGE